MAKSRVPGGALAPTRTNGRADGDCVGRLRRRGDRRGGLLPRGCCELNTTAHGLIIDIGTQLGIRAATAAGEDVNQCVALETTRVRQRIAIEIWSNYQDYICARLKFADPTPDKQRANEDEAVKNAEEQELHAQRYAIQAYLHRTHQPLELGV